MWEFFSLLNVSVSTIHNGTGRTAIGCNHFILTHTDTDLEQDSPTPAFGPLDSGIDVSIVTKNIRKMYLFLFL